MAGKEFAFGFVISATLQGGFKASFSSAGNEVTKLNKSVSEYNKTYKMLTSAQKKGIITEGAYANALAKLNPKYESLITKQQQYLSMQGKINKTKSNMSGYGKKALAAGGFAYGLINLTKDAVNFESSMADVRKVVDFDTPQQFKKMSKDILDLSTKIPMTADGLAAIVAAGGQSGINKSDLLPFAESAAKMGVAFDITADQAGEMMAKWRTAFKMGQPEVIALADKINYLGNTTAASAPLISDVVTRVGPLGAVGGVASGEIAALGASIVGAGINSEIGATGIKNLILALTSGESATKAQTGAFATLGLDAVEMAQYMQKDAKGAILTVLKGLQGLDKAKQASTLKDLFGKESLGAISPLLSNLDKLEENFAGVANAAKYGGSMEAEFKTRSETAANATILMNNNINAAKIALGNGLLPVIAPLTGIIGGAANSVGKFATENSTLTSILLGSVGAIASVAAIAYSLGWIYSGVKLAVLGTKSAYELSGKALGKYNLVTKAASLLTKGWAIAQGLFNTVLAACPIGWLIIGIAAVILAGTLLYKHWDTVKQFFTTLWDSPIARIAFFVTGPVGWIIGAVTAIIANWDTLAAYWDYFWDNPSAAIFRFTSYIQEQFTSAETWLREKWQSISNFLSTPIFGKVNITASGNGAEVAENAYGGIYGRGTFLTTFAENSGESAIPHTPNKRNIGLLAKTNEIMGNPLGTSGSINATFAPQITVQGNTDTAEISTLLDQKMREFKAMLAEVQNQNRRLSYG